MLKQSVRLIRKQIQIFPTHFVHNYKNRENVCLLYKQFAIQKLESPLTRFEHLNTVYLNCRSYSKSKDKKKEKKKVVKVDEHELGKYFDVEKLFSDIQKPLELFKEELVQHATLRTSPGAIENLKVQHQGGTYRIQDLAEVGKKNPRLYVLDFSSFPETIPNVLAAFRKSELNINIQQDGNKLFIPLPNVTKEHREVLAKKCKLYFVKCKDAIRDIQMKYIKSLQGIEKLSVEEKFRLTDQLTALGNKKISAAEEILKTKQEEIMNVQEL